uniref:T-cell surface glycoprotein CD8 alpha chain isoform X1 n=1 Tax=Scatophagus argus TaxID=75038 RepID=UPI001ED7D048|nr:T-cell surface glycoprotein CD8 alpha chain isoform X1 [Scatophagus argus]
MNQKWIHIVVILVFYQQMTSGAGGDKVVKDKTPVDIVCNPEGSGTMIVWFRVLDTSGMEFIASFSTNGIKKADTASSSSVFDYSKITQKTIVLKSFDKTKDSGAYGCALLQKGVELKFGSVTRLVGEKEKVTPKPDTTTATPKQCTTAKPCVCTKSKPGDAASSVFCNTIILGPLVGGSGLLLLLLIVTALYCNKIRTRRCPHHYKRKPRTTGGKQMVTIRPV